MLPTQQLHAILKRIPACRSGTSPFVQLDVLYEYMLSFNPNYEDVCPILAAILMIPGRIRSLTCIKLVLGLSKGQVALTLRGMLT